MIFVEKFRCDQLPVLVLVSCAHPTIGRGLNEFSVLKLTDISGKVVLDESNLIALSVKLITKLINLAVRLRYLPELAIVISETAYLRRSVLNRRLGGIPLRGIFIHRPVGKNDFCDVRPAHAHFCTIEPFKTDKLAKMSCIFIRIGD